MIYIGIILLVMLLTLSGEKDNKPLISFFIFAFGICAILLGLTIMAYTIGILL